MPFGFAPDKWLDCNGQILQAAQYQALAALIGFKYGGDGRTTFALPDLRGRVALHMGANVGMDANVGMGTVAGSETVALTATQVPSHTHTFTVSKDAADTLSPAGLYPAKGDRMAWIAPVDQPTVLDSDTLAASGASAGHENRMPVLGLRFCIAIQGLWPPRQ